MFLMAYYRVPSILNIEAPSSQIIQFSEMLPWVDDSLKWNSHQNATW